jgi:hypothetical protein
MLVGKNIAIYNFILIVPVGADFLLRQTEGQKDGQRNKVN